MEELQRQQQNDTLELSLKSLTESYNKLKQQGLQKEKELQQVQREFQVFKEQNRDCQDKLKKDLQVAQEDVVRVMESRDRLDLE